MLLVENVAVPGKKKRASLIRELRGAQNASLISKAAPKLISEFSALRVWGVKQGRFVILRFSLVLQSLGYPDAGKHSTKSVIVSVPQMLVKTRT